jgi:flagellar motor switch protein FliM
MAKDVLSQSEIDSIIMALGSGDIQKKTEAEEMPDDANIVLYDFRRPNKFSKDQMRTLKNIHENFARMLANFLTAYLRLPVSVKLESVSQVTYEEFLNSLPLPTLVTVFRLGEDQGTALLETNSYFSFPIIGILFGGEGKLLRKMRELTDIELSVMKRINQKILDNLRYTWEDFADLHPVIENLDTNPQFSQLIASNEAVILLSFSTIIADNEGFINLCLPFITLEPILANLTVQNWHARQDKFKENGEENSEKNLEKRLKHADIEVSAVIGRTNITIGDFLQFEEGDIIILDRTLEEPIDLCIDGIPLFQMNLGKSGNKLAGVISNILSEEDPL